MNRYRIEGNWQQLSGKVKEHWGLLLSDRACVFAGRQAQAAGSALERYGITQDAAQDQLKDFLQRNRQWNISHRP